MSKHEKPGFSYVTYIGAAPDRVWQALTDGALTRQYWYGRRAESDWKVGSPVTCLLYTSPSPRDTERSRMPSSA